MPARPLGGGDATDDIARRDEDAFAAVVKNLMQDLWDSQKDITTFADICHAHAADLREQALGASIQRAARSLHIRTLADELEAEAATWQLLAHLHGNSDPRFPGGMGGPRLAGSGGQATTAQRAAQEVAADPALNRVARVVAWLEHLAGYELQEEDLLTMKRGGAGFVFARDEGVPTQTRLALVQRGALAGAGPPCGHQAAEQISAAGGGHYEEALCSSLGGHVGRILPVCGKWVDVLWAFSRCWLELELMSDSRLGLPLPLMQISWYQQILSHGNRASNRTCCQMVWVSLMAASQSQGWQADFRARSRISSERLRDGQGITGTGGPPSRGNATACARRSWCWTIPPSPNC